jgi:phosphoenolpyruvate carboxykinase (GTP)
VSKPRYEGLDWRGRDFPEELFEQLQEVDPVRGRREVIEHEALFLLLHSRLPKVMVYARELLICRT